MATTEEIQLLFEWDGLLLAGSLHLPRGAGPHPAVLMLQGSGPADRDSGGYFAEIRRTFVGQGVATFAFDKPGCGASQGDWRHYGLIGRADQAIAALDLVRNHPGVDGERVGIWGHSQGGWLVQMLAGRPIELAFAVASSAPTITVPDQILFASETEMRNQGFDDEAVQGALDLTTALFRAATDGADSAWVSQQLLEPASRESWYDSWPGIDADSWEHDKLLIGEVFEPLDALRRVECRLLTVYGGLDSLLPPWQGAEETGRALAEARSDDATVVVFPRGDHRLQKPGTEAFADGYLDLLGDWTARRAR